MTFDSFAEYFVVVFIATISPGPSMLLALNHGVNHGVMRSIYSAIGNVLGNLLMALVSIAGLGVILAASGRLFNCIKWLGACYLILVGIKTVFSSDKNAARENEPGSRQYRKSGSLLFLDGFLIAIGNPKGILFFTALFPQFIDARASSIGRFLAVFITLGLIAFGCYMLYAGFGVKLNRLFRRQAFRKAFNRITGSLLIGTCLTIAFSKK